MKAFARGNRADRSRLGRRDLCAWVAWGSAGWGWERQPSRAIFGAGGPVRDPAPLGRRAEPARNVGPEARCRAEVRGPFGSIATRCPGVRISEHLPRLAVRMDRLAIIRSVHHDEAPIHETGCQLLQTGRLCRAGEEAPHFGSVVAHVRGARNGLPAFALLPRPIRPPGSTSRTGRRPPGSARAARHFPSVQTRPASDFDAIRPGFVHKRARLRRARIPGENPFDLARARAHPR